MENENATQSKEKCGWTKFSESKLVELEKKILQVVKTAYRTWFVPIGSIVGNEDKIWTILVNEESDNTPLVLLHGFAAALGFWCQNLDSLSKHRPVYAIDLLGFGHSSRPNFSSDGTEAEHQMVESLEAWRKQLEIENFILLGHSFGGYLATSYAIKYPERVKHLILADPWGFSERPDRISVSDRPFWVRALRILLYPLVYLNPLATVRAAGPMGPWLVRKVRHDISEKFAGVLEDKDIISEYIYQCNSRYPSGESAFNNMRNLAWSKTPMIHRYDKIKEDLPITIIFGEKSWITKDPGYVLKDQRPESVEIEIISNAGHHVNADQPDLFNDAVLNACLMYDASGIDRNILAAASSEKIIEEEEIEIDDEGTVRQISFSRSEEYQLNPAI